MNPTDILLSIAIVGIYTMIHVYLRTKLNRCFCEIQEPPRNTPSHTAVNLLLIK